MFFITIIVLLSYSPVKSYACSCAEPGPVKEELERSSAVFSGKVVKIEDMNENKFTQSSADPLAILFEVKETWKGIGQTEVVVYTERSSASCGYEFTLNEEYLVYARVVDGELRASFCSRTTPLLSAKADMDELGKGKKPIELASNEKVNKFDDQLPSENTYNNLIYIILFIAILLIVAIYVARRKRKKY